VPLLIELSDRDHPSIVHAFGVVLKQIVLNPLIMSACFGAAVAALHIELPVALDRTITFLQNAAAPTEKIRHHPIPARSFTLPTRF
jgi:predicted permease